MLNPFHGLPEPLPKAVLFRPTVAGKPSVTSVPSAVELFPDYPENYVYLAEALRDNGRMDEAKAALRKVLDAEPWPDQQFESGQWKAQALKLRDSFK